jgi:glyoxylase-like metal-dependent hydrolase (beta-lactamase superfamily II)
VPHETVKVGAVEISALLDVDIPDEPMADAFPGAPTEELDAARSTYPAIYNHDGTWRLRVRAWLIRHPRGVLLLDTGIGPGTSPAMAWSPTVGTTRASLADVDASPDDVDTVVISHSHSDHIGGVLLADGSPAFPRARYVLQRADHDWEEHAAREGENPTWTTLVEPLSAAGVLDLVDGDHRLTDAIELHHAPGHTPGHQVVRIASDGGRALLSADTWNHPVQLPHPEWWAGSDDDHAAAEATRRALLAEVVDRDVLVAPTHFGEGFGHVTTGADGAAGWSPSAEASDRG